MGVPLQLILGVLLTLAQYSASITPNLRQIREAPPPSPTPLQNVTEINNRDLNKIIKDNPKTETVDSKAKFVHNIHSYEELPLKLAKSKDERQNNANRSKSEETESSGEDYKGATKLEKEKQRGDSSRSIDIDASQFWSDDFHSKNVFTLAPAPDIEKFHEPSYFAFEGTRHPSFEASADLTTPTTKIFDQLFKETVESVEQNIETDDEDHDRDDANNEDGQNKDADLSVEDQLKKSENESIEFVKTKAIVNNETVEKNSIHKDVNFEHIKKLDYENIFNNTKVYGEETTKGETSELNGSTERTTISPSLTTSTVPTRKSSLLKELYTEKGNSNILSNNIETEITNPIKAIITSTTSSTTKGDKGEFQEVKITTAFSSSEIPTTESSSTITSTTSSTTTSTATVSTSLLKMNISDQENHVIPLQLGSESTPIQESSSEPSPTTDIKENHNVETRVAIDESTESYNTETITSTEIPQTTTLFDYADEVSDGTTTTLLAEDTTSFIVDNSTETSDATTEMSSSTEETTTGIVETTTADSGQRTSKSLENSIVTEPMVKVHEKSVENSTQLMDATTESTARNELDGTTLNDGRNTETKSIDNTIEKTNDTDETTTEEMVTTSTIPNMEITTLELTSQSMLVNGTTQKIALMSEATTHVETTVNSTEKIPQSPPTTTETKPTTQKEKAQSTTTEYVFVHIENNGINHTTLLPEVLSPNLNYSTTVAVDNEANKIRKEVLNEQSTNSTEGSTSSTTTSSTTTKTPSTTTPELIAANVTTTPEDGTDTSTENGFSKDGDDGGGGGNKGKIAAIAISSVGAVCLVILAGLLYVMKKRQKRLNYGPRCRPVSLDDYSIDNLSVYNSVRRKGNARFSKRSFGNPAFEDPVAPTHPLNFPALAKFAANFEDIKAEFEEIPQISARTSELPDGCETKNRYANVIPLPETRVFLKPIDGYPNSDYINANYLTGPKNVKGYYIASQGPMQNTVDDFWRMIWEQQAKVILMLTHLVENGLEKCVDYLPESEVIDCSRLFGDFQIVLKKQEVKDKYIISTLQLKNMVSNSWREVTHFWYLGWPEKGVPAEGNSLIAFLIEARSYMKTATIDKRDAINGIQNGGPQNEHNPVVVHCSPGTGRTGVAIACDIAIREFETTRLVDIPKIVYRIRRDRAGAVQTKEQYIFIYKVVSLYATKLTGEALENF